MQNYLLKFSFRLKQVHREEKNRLHQFHTDIRINNLTSEFLKHAYEVFQTLIFLSYIKKYINLLRAGGG